MGDIIAKIQAYGCLIAKKAENLSEEDFTITIRFEKNGINGQPELTYEETTSFRK